MITSTLLLIRVNVCLCSCCLLWNMLNLFTPMKTYVVDYRYKGKTYYIELNAFNEIDAVKRLEALQLSGTIAYEIKSTTNVWNTMKHSLYLKLMLFEFGFVHMRCMVDVWYEVLRKNVNTKAFWTLLTIKW